MQKSFYNHADLSEYSLESRDLIIEQSEELNAIIVPHEIAKKYAKSFCKNIPIFAVNCPVDFNMFQNTAKNAEYIAYCGRIAPMKGLMALPALFGRIRKLYPDIKFKIVGDSDHLPGSDKYRNKIIEQFAEDKTPVEVTGYVEELRKYFRNIKLVVAPSLVEGFGLYMLEANAFGIPVVTNSVGFATQYIKNGENGYIVPFKWDGVSKELDQRTRKRFFKFIIKALETKFDTEKIRRFAFPYISDIYNRKFKEIISSIIK